MGEFEENIKGQVESNVGIDFDGVIHKNSKGHHDGTIYDDSIEGTKEALVFLSQRYNLIIYTCKARPERPLIDGKTGIELIWEWLEKHELSQYISEVTNRKPIAAFYIDDKAIRFFTWAQTLVDVKEFEEGK